MRLVVTGRHGQVAASLIDLGSRRPGFEIVAVGRPELDLADAASIGPALTAARPDVIVSAAAHTAVDDAEVQTALAMTVNSEAVGIIGETARRLDVPVIHLSTDYVFAGTGDRAWIETDPVAPINAYGRSKLAGEQALATAQPAHVILRTAWVYSAIGRNFVRTMLGRAQAGQPVQVVDDQTGNPTSAADIAEAILAVAPLLAERSSEVAGLYHFAGTGETTWHGFAQAIMDGSAALGGPAVPVTAIRSADRPQTAPRPANSRLDSTRFAATFGHASPHWRESLQPVVRQLLGGAQYR